MSPVAASKVQEPEALSVSQMLHLMRLELDRAQLHEYPISALMVGLDGMAAPDDLPLRQTLMLEMFRELKALTFRQKIRGLGFWRDHFVLAIFPHVDPQRTLALAEELLEAGRSLSPAGLPEGQKVAFSAGVGHNLHPGEVTFDSLLEDAETGLNVAQSAGGGRCVQWKEVESELDRLREELEGQIRELGEQAGGSGVADEDTWDRGLLEKVLELFAGEPETSKAVVRLEKQVVGLLTTELERRRELPTFLAMVQRAEQIDLLERRIRKLTDQLDSTESELRRVAVMKNVETGIASIYRTVQGLSGDAENAEQKRAMLQDIFAANLALRETVASQT